MNEQEIFLDTRSIGDTLERLAFLEQDCEGDKSMFQRIVALSVLTDREATVVLRQFSGGADPCRFGASALTIGLG
jgi:hypothetical protein